LLEFGEILFLSSLRKRHLVCKNWNLGHVGLFEAGMAGPHTIEDFILCVFELSSNKIVKKRELTSRFPDFFYRCLKLFRIIYSDKKETRNFRVGRDWFYQKWKFRRIQKSFREIIWKNGEKNLWKKWKERRRGRIWIGSFWRLTGGSLRTIWWLDGRRSLEVAVRVACFDSALFVGNMDDCSFNWHLSKGDFFKNLWFLSFLRFWDCWE